MFLVSMTNFHYFLGTFKTLEAALDCGRAKGFEFSVWRKDESSPGGIGALVASWSPIGGTRRFS